MMKSLVSLDTVHIYIRRNFIMSKNNACYVICDFFDGFDYIKDG